MVKLTSLNCLSSVSKILTDEWDYNFNYPLTPDDVVFNDYKARGWICQKCGNKWQARVYQRYNGLGKCLKCNSIGITHPKLSKEWDAETNYPLTVFNVTSGSHKKVAWICLKCGNRWIAIVKNRTMGSGCPNCNKKLLGLIRSTPKSNNNLSISNPELVSQWHPTKNGNLVPSSICSHSNERIWWQCQECKYEWQSVVNIRSKSKYKLCPQCPKPIPKKISLSFLEPDIAKEFFKSKNPHVNIDNITLGSHWMIQWQCSRCGYLWNANPYARIRGYNNCPNCCDKIILKNGEKCASLIEAYYYLKYKSEKIKFLHNKKYGGLGVFGNCRYDFYIPSKQTYIEVTSFQKGFKKWFSYLRRIIEKKHYVEKVLGGKFIFIRETLTTKQIKFVNKNRQKYISKSV